MLFIFSVLFAFMASAVITYLLIADPEKAKAEKLAKQDSDHEKSKEALKGVHEYISKSVEKRQSEGGFTLFTEEELELAGIELTPGQMILYTGGFSVIAFVIGLLTINPFLAFFIGLSMFIVARKVVKRKIKKQRVVFQKQLEQALRIISSSLTSGQSLNGAILSVAQDGEEPMVGEMTRIINEARIGNDIIKSFEECARRMDSEDFAWFASAASLQRATGGNLTEIIETVAETIRDRSELRNKVKAYSSEGRASAYVLMGIPVVIGGVFTVLNPSYMLPLFNTGLGNMCLGVSGVLYVVSALWMKKIADIKI